MINMDLNKFTVKCQEALQVAQTKAINFNHQEVDGEHLLLVLLEQPDGLIPRSSGSWSRRLKKSRALADRDPSPERCTLPSG
jgi:ATP-dependent Clp protease ATP-binding subunit ClpA